MSVANFISCSPPPGAGSGTAEPTRDGADCSWTGTDMPGGVPLRALGLSAVGTGSRESPDRAQGIEQSDGHRRFSHEVIERVAHRTENPFEGSEPGGDRAFLDRLEVGEFQTGSGREVGLTQITPLAKLAHACADLSILPGGNVIPMRPKLRVRREPNCQPRDFDGAARRRHLDFKR